jgi:hypothetical protein
MTAVLRNIGSHKLGFLSLIAATIILLFYHSTAVPYRLPAPFHPGGHPHKDLFHPYQDTALDAFDDVPQDVSEDDTSDAGSSELYSVKPIAYIFPQYYPFPENDKIWGANFTEWDNVRKATKNSYGLETIRPHESVGYYNGVEFATRQRQGRFLRDSGFYGAVFHHYWFAGKPVMDGVIKAMLKDGEPNIPFMLSWANEPWTATWDGMDSSKVFIRQDYGSVEDWRQHFDWLLPFFRHPKYIRSEGRIQFLVYKPGHMGNLGPHMFAAWRQWAVEEGLGGMDIVETRWAPEQWNNAMPDAVNEFGPHVAGHDHQRELAVRRIARVYHRGSYVCWDATPRHVSDGGGNPHPTCHPKMYQWHLVEMLRKIKSEPNPVGAENFLFVNALNEWGEGNVLEPSVQFGDGYGRAMRNALRISDQIHVWPDKFLENARSRSTRANTQGNQTADVCVLVRTSPPHWDGAIYSLREMLRSLQGQKNQNWRAIVFPTDASEFPGLDEIVLRTLDTRIELVRPPTEAYVNQSAEDWGAQPTDWVIENMVINAESPCANARYLLITNGDSTYKPKAFDSLSNNQGDLIGLNVESLQTLWHHEKIQRGSFEDSCVRLDNVSLRDGGALRVC